MENIDLFKKYPDGHWHDRLASHAEDFSDFLIKCLGYNSIVVDIGCGKGRDTSLFAERHPLAIGIDSDPIVINEAKKISKRSFFVMDAENMKFPNDSIDAVFCINVMHYINQQKSLEHIYRMLRKNGHAFIHFNLSIIDKDNTVDYTQDEGEIMNMLKDFKIVHKTKFDRVDQEPIIHTHHILEMIMKK